MNIAVASDPPVIDMVAPTEEFLRREARQRDRLGIAALLEGTSLLMLVLVAVPLKHFANFPAVASLIGPIHGLLLIVYIWTAFRSAGLFGWPIRRALVITLPALLPFGTLVVWHRLKRGTEQ